MAHDACDRSDPDDGGMPPVAPKSAVHVMNAPDAAGSGAQEVPVPPSGHSERRRPLISVVTVVFNGAKTLRDTIESIVPQLDDEAEFLIIDGGSTDGTVNIIREYESVLSYWVSEPDRGIYDAWNKAVDVSNGEFIAFVGADDALAPGALQTYAAHIRQRPDVEYWSSRVAFGSHGRVIGRPWNWSEFRRYMTVAHVGSLHRRDLYARYGRYDVSFRIVGDYEFLLRVGKNLKAGFVDVVTVKMGDGGVSNKHASRALLETKLAKIKTGSVSGLLVLVDWVWAILKARMRWLLLLGRRDNQS